MSMNPYIYQELVRPALPFATSSLLLLRTAKKKEEIIFRYISQ
jgi:hypothetical protein